MIEWHLPKTTVPSCLKRKRLFYFNETICAACSEEALGVWQSSFDELKAECHIQSVSQYFSCWFRFYGIPLTARIIASNLNWDIINCFCVCEGAQARHAPETARPKECTNICDLTYPVLSLEGYKWPLLSEVTPHPIAASLTGQKSPALLNQEIIFHSCLWGFGTPRVPHIPNCDFQQARAELSMQLQIISSHDRRRMCSIFTEAEAEEMQVRCHFYQAHLHFVPLNRHLTLSGWSSIAEVQEYSAILVLAYTTVSQHKCKHAQKFLEGSVPCVTNWGFLFLPLMLSTAAYTSGCIRMSFFQGDWIFVSLTWQSQLYLNFV